MANFLDEVPLNRQDPLYAQLCEVLIRSSTAEGIPFLEELAGRAKLDMADFPINLPDLRQTVFKLVNKMAEMGKLRRFVEVASDETTIRESERESLRQLLGAPATQEIIVRSYFITPELFVLDRDNYRSALLTLANTEDPVKVLLIHGGPRSGKTHCRHLFERLAKNKGGAPVYLCEGLVVTIDDLLGELFAAVDALDAIPPRNTTPDAWYRAVCRMLLTKAKKLNKPLWIAIDDLGNDPDGAPLLDGEIRAFFNQFALHMTNADYREWFRLLLIAYPEGPLPTEWKREHVREEWTTVDDIRPADIVNLLDLWCLVNNQNLPQKSDEFAQVVFEQAKEIADKPESEGMLRLLHDGLVAALRNLARSPA